MIPCSTRCPPLPLNWKEDSESPASLVQPPWREVAEGWGEGALSSPDTGPRRPEQPVWGQGMAPGPLLSSLQTGSPQGQDLGSRLFCPLGWDPQGQHLSPLFWPFKYGTPRLGQDPVFPSLGTPSDRARVMSSVPLSSSN